VKKGTKMRTVLVYCLWVDTDGVTPVNMHGEVATSKRQHCYSWEPQRRGPKWLKANAEQWKPLPTQQRSKQPRKESNQSWI
jgi:hypothetical protein